MLAVSKCACRCATGSAHLSQRSLGEPEPLVRLLERRQGLQEKLETRGRGSKGSGMHRVTCEEEATKHVAYSGWHEDRN